MNGAVTLLHAYPFVAWVGTNLSFNRFAVVLLPRPPNLRFFMNEFYFHMPSNISLRKPPRCGHRLFEILPPNLD